MRLKTLICAAVFVLFGAFTALGDEVTVGEAPDPYEAIWASCTLEDMEALRQAVYYESTKAFNNDDRSQDECSIAVVETVLNRVLDQSGDFKNTISGVVYQRGQFSVKDRLIRNENVEYAIEYVKQHGRTVLPGYDYCYFATKKQSLGRDHVWHGSYRANGKTKTGMWFCREK